MEPNQPTVHEQRLGGLAENAGERLLAIVQQLAVELQPQREGRFHATLESSLERDLGIDSLGRAELLLRLERAFGMHLPDETLTTAETPSDLLRALGAANGRPLPIPANMATPAAVAGGRAAPGSTETLVDALEFHLGAHPERPHIQLLTGSRAQQTITYGDLWHQAQAVAAGLGEHDLELGEAVAIMLPTSPEFFYAFFGVLLAGGVPVPLYPPVRRSQIEDHLRRQAGILRNALARVLITPPDARLIGQLLYAQVDSLRKVTTVEQLRMATAAPSRLAATADATALLQYTSGSTSAPKGVILSHANLLANIRAMGEVFDVGPDDVVVSWLPLYHDMGLIGAWLGSLYYACPLVLMSPVSFLARPERWLWAIHRYRGTFSVAPNFAYELCVHRIRDRDLEGLDLSTWRVAGNGAEPISAHTLQRFCERFASYGFRSTALMPMYGLAEASVALTIPAEGRGPLVDRVKRQPFMRHERAVPAAANDREVLEFVGCGQPLPGHEVRVVDATGGEAGERQEGRLQFRGPSATTGYFRNPEATWQLIDDGWLETGDRGYIAAGDIYPTGRIKDLIIRAGRNIYPQEVEEAVGDLPGIRKGRVVAFGSREPGARTERLVVLAETRAQPDARPELERRVREVVTDLLELPPDDVVLAPAGTVLKTSSGKVRRTACRNLYEAGAIGHARRALWWQLVRLGAVSLRPALRRGRRWLVAAAYAVYFWTVIGLFAAVTALYITTLPRGLRRRLLKPTASLAVRLSGIGPVVCGQAPAPSANSSVLVTNHASYLDGLVLAAVLPERFAFVAKREFATQFPAGFLLRRLGAAFVERFDPARSIEDARRLVPLLRAGQSLVVFAEGTFDRRPGLRAFQMGAFVVAAEVGAPVIPTAIRGTRSILRSESWFPHRGKVAVTFGPPIKPVGREWGDAVRLRDLAREAILEACGEPDLAHEAKLVVVPDRHRSDGT